MKDKTIENLLELDGTRFVIDEALGLWVKFEVKKVVPTKERPHGMKYSLTLHDRFNRRLMGYDNAHNIEDTNTDLKLSYDHWHRNIAGQAKRYSYENAAKLLEDFWKAVEKIWKALKEEA